MKKRLLILSIFLTIMLLFIIAFPSSAYAMDPRYSLYGSLHPGDTQKVILLGDCFDINNGMMFAGDNTPLSGTPWPWLNSNNGINAERRANDSQVLTLLPVYNKQAYKIRYPNNLYIKRTGNGFVGYGLTTTPNYSEATNWVFELQGAGVGNIKYYKIYDDTAEKAAFRADGETNTLQMNYLGSLLSPWNNWSKFFVFCKMPDPPSINEHPADTTVTYGQNASFTAAASGDPAPSVKWQVDCGKGWSDIAGATGNTLTLTLPQVASSGNYYRAVFFNQYGNVVTNSAKLTINPATLIVTADNKNKTYDGEVFSENKFTATITGFVSGDDIGVVSGSAAYTGSAVTAVNAGTYDIVPVIGSLSASNYVFSPANGTLTINKANAAISVTGWAGEYDGLPHGAAGSALGINNEDLNAWLDLGESFTEWPGGTTTWTFSGHQNYNAASGTAVIDIRDTTSPLVDIGGIIYKDGDTLDLGYIVKDYPQNITYTKKDLASGFGYDANEILLKEVTGAESIPTCVEGLDLTHVLIFADQAGNSTAVTFEYKVVDLGKIMKILTPLYSGSIYNRNSTIPIKLQFVDEKTGKPLKMGADNFTLSLKLFGPDGQTVTVSRTNLVNDLGSAEFELKDSGHTYQFNLNTRVGTPLKLGEYTLEIHMQGKAMATSQCIKTIKFILR